MATAFSQPQSSGLHIREIDPASESEINLVAQRMYDTVIEVEGPEQGAKLHSVEWLRERVKWHLNPQAVLATVLLAINQDGEIIGHTILRRDDECAVDEPAKGQVFGLISTTYVIPAARRGGVADRLLEAGEAWIQAQGLAHATTWTAANNVKLINLYAKHGYHIAERHAHPGSGSMMVRLERTF